MGRSLTGLVLLALSTTTALAGDVLTLTADTFADAVKAHDKLIVELYAPWCGHCSRLAPQYEEAASTLKAEGVTLAKIDATTPGNKALTTQLGVRAFPTLKAFRGTEASAVTYDGPLKADGIVAFSQDHFKPAFAQVTTSEAAAAASTPSDVISVVGSFPDGADSAAAEAFKAAAATLYKDARFLFTTEAQLMKQESIVLVRNFDENVVKFRDTFEEAAIAAFVVKNSVPRLLSLDSKAPTSKALQKALDDDVPKVYGCAPADSEGIKAFKEQLVAMKEAHTDVHVIYMDPASNSKNMTAFRATKTSLPAILIDDPRSERKYNSGVVELSKVECFVEAFKAGWLTPVQPVSGPSRKQGDNRDDVNRQVFHMMANSGMF